MVLAILLSGVSLYGAGLKDIKSVETLSPFLYFYLSSFVYPIEEFITTIMPSNQVHVL